MEPPKFEEEYRRHWRYVFVIAKELIGRDEDAEDAAMDVFVRKFTRWHTFDPERGTLKQWLRCNTVNRCIEHLRRTRIPTMQDPDDRASPGNRDDALALELCLDRLAPEDRAVLVLKYAHGCTWEEVSDDVGLPVRQCRRRAEKARESMARCMGIDDGRKSR